MPSIICLFELGHPNDLNGDVKEALKSSFFVAQKAAAPKNGFLMVPSEVVSLRPTTSREVSKFRPIRGLEIILHRYTDTYTDRESTYCKSVLYEQRLQEVYRNNMARTKMSVRKVLKWKQININDSDVNENIVCFTEKKNVAISYPRTIDLDNDKKKLGPSCYNFLTFITLKLSFISMVCHVLFHEFGLKSTNCADGHDKKILNNT